jgi:Spy/CpxP family protein refolding chaperone
MKVRRIAIAAVATLGFAAAGLAWAGHRGMGPLGHGGHGGHGRFAERFARLHIEAMSDRMLRVAEATPEQKVKVEAILEKAFADHDRFRKEHQSLRDECLNILTADGIDRGRLEELRAKHLLIADQGSRQVVSALADIAEVLTPEQRQKLAAHARQMFE